MTEHEPQDSYRSTQSERWYGWSSPLELGLFVVLIAAAIDLVRLAFR